MLWANSGGRCAICHTELVMKIIGSNKQSIIGEECHIVAQNINGARGISVLTAAQKDSYDNLILLCNIHHKIVDDHPDIYTVQKLNAVKAVHEKWVFEKLSPTVRNNVKKDDWIIVQKTETGQQLLKMLGGSDLSHFNNDDLQTENEVEIVIDFLQELEDYIYMWGEMGIKQRIQAQSELDRTLHHLQACGFLVYSCQRPETWIFGGIKDKVLTAYVFVLRHNNPLVRKNDKIDELIGINKTLKGEFAPFILYEHN